MNGRKRSSANWKNWNFKEETKMKRLMKNYTTKNKLVDASEKD